MNLWNLVFNCFSICCIKHLDSVTEFYYFKHLDNVTE